MYTFQKSFVHRMRNFLIAFSVAIVSSQTPSVLAQEDKAPGYKLPRPSINDALAYQSREVMINGVRMSYIEAGKGDPILFVHGNPTSSYLWRNVMPHVSQQGRVIALDLIGMGRSEKPPTVYRYQQHYAAFEKFVDALKLNKIILVVHDWGAALGFDYASRNPARVQGIAFMEGILPPLFPQPSFEAMGEEMGGMFRALKDPIQGHKMVIEENMFIEKILPGFINRPLGETAMSAYRQPFMKPEDREAVLSWPREVPIAGEPKDVVARMVAIQSFMTTTTKPVLLLYAEPGVLVSPKLVPWYVDNIRNLETSYVGQGLHFIQEDHPDAVGRALSDWIRRHTKSGRKAS